jgi:hypothetical protein
MAMDDTGKRRKDDPQVEQEGLVVDVPDIERELLWPAQCVAAVDLRPSGNPRTNLETPRLLVAVKLVIAVDEGAVGRPGSSLPS